MVSHLKSFTPMHKKQALSARFMEITTVAKSNWNLNYVYQNLKSLTGKMS
jgi:hypothetical protein